MRDVVQRFLVKEGFRVAIAAGGEEGLRLARDLRPDAITLDVMMPGLDGWAVLTALKGDRATAAIPVVMLTMLDDRSLGYALGATDYLTKPIDRERLVAALRRRYRRETARAGRGRRPRPADAPAPHAGAGRLRGRRGRQRPSRAGAGA